MEKTEKQNEMVKRRTQAHKNETSLSAQREKCRKKSMATPKIKKLKDDTCEKCQYLTCKCKVKNTKNNSKNNDDVSDGSLTSD